MTIGQSADDEPDDALLRAIAERWDEILAFASDQQRDRLRALVSGTSESDPAEARAAISDELLDLLPPDHPVMDVVRTGVLFGVAPDRSEVSLAESLRRLSALVLPGVGSAWITAGQARSEIAPVDEFDRRVQARLLALPAYGAADIGSNGTEPAGDGLILLRRQDDGWQVPAFQFADKTRPWPIVQEINRLLDSEGDPWGVTCWWVDPHERLNAVPADLLGTGQDDVLREASLAIGEEY